ncbi:efflux RND transporter periplasmic adaptor subunit [Glaciecola sp. 33A]|jgi:membrane fusion protein (multidrug efflux system)|uniref:efflux RND transporter periplasmic adaptor subunit n=1 Tax=Glaciecola sp. 33A TaxID=2057807 RepID=UPI000C33E88B|nr:efflux RND transporter periplasmic adaptor subunit [Glaciecola sp. 33A]PKI02008.1 efflux RND transporter periplasmic adaptor subunit [Glaciecola sp. 33A]
MHTFRICLMMVFLSTTIYGCSDTTKDPQGPTQKPAQTVSILTLEIQNVDISMDLPGRVTPFKQSQVRPQVDGVIIKRFFEEGAQVTQGQQLYQIDDARYSAQLNSAHADVKSALANQKTMQAKAARYKDLVSRNAVSQQEFDDVIAQNEQANANISVAEAKVTVAKVNVDYTKVYAPIDGQISRSYVTEGALVTGNQSQQLATITQLNPIYVDMQESGAAILELRREMQQQESLPVSILVNETNSELYSQQGQLKFSEVTIDQSTGAITLRAVMPNPNSILLPGLFVTARVHIGSKDAVLVPQRATMRQPDGSLIIYLVDVNNVVIAKKINPIKSIGSDYVVTENLDSGEKLIVTGYQKVRPGASVNAVPWTTN